MAKAFFEVFPNLEISGQAQALFEQVTVTKVTVTSVRDRMRVYISSEKLIHKKYIYAV